MENEIRKGRIYSYFYGVNNVFQQFIIAVGILLIVLSPVADRAKELKRVNAYDKAQTLSITAQKLEQAYDTLYYDYSNDGRYNFDCELYEEAKIAEGDKNREEKTAYNKALKDYNEAAEKLQAAKENSASVALEKIAEDLEDAYRTLYYEYRYDFDCELYEEAEIEEKDRYSQEKTEYNTALNDYNLAVEAAEAAAEEEEKSSEFAALISNAEKLKAAYEKLYNEYSKSDDCNFICVRYEEAEIKENDKFSEEKEAHNKALKEYIKAEKKAEKAFEKYISLRDSESAAQILLLILGSVIIIAGIVWSIIKKISFNKKPCEEAYDEELKIKIEEAKVKALEKLNIVAEQIEKVEPVVLNGIATYDATKNPVGKIVALSQRLTGLLPYVNVVLIGAVAASLYGGISLIFGSAFFVPLLIAIALVAVLGIKIYNKYENNSYVNLKTIKKLATGNPNLLTRLGTDDSVRVSLPAITVYMFGDEQIYMYYQYLDIITGKIFFEGIHEYFYEDIVGVISAQETKKMFKRAGFFKSPKAVNYLRESITVVSSGCQHSETYIVPTGSSLLDTSFVGMRNLIRQKKENKN